jgi:hypothetical protein
MLVLDDISRRAPVVTGTSVLALKYKDGVMLAADNLGELTCLLCLMSKHCFSQFLFQRLMARSLDSRTSNDYNQLVTTP